MRARKSACVHTARIGYRLSRSMLMYFVLCRPREHWWSIFIASQVVWIRQLSGTSLDLSHSDLVRYHCYKRKSVGAPPVHFADLRAFLVTGVYMVHGVYACTCVCVCVCVCVAGGGGGVGGVYVHVCVYMYNYIRAETIILGPRQQYCRLSFSFVIMSPMLTWQPISSQFWLVS